MQTRILRSRRKTLSLRITRIPVLDSGIFYFSLLVDNNLNDSRMKLVFISHRSRTSFQI